MGSEREVNNMKTLCAPVGNTRKRMIITKVLALTILQSLNGPPYSRGRQHCGTLPLMCWVSLSGL